MKRDGGKRRREETTGEKTAGADGGSYSRGSGGSGLRAVARAAALCPDGGGGSGGGASKGEGDQTEETRAEAARALASALRRGTCGTDGNAAPSARSGAWSGVASGAAHRGGAVVAVVLGVAVIVQQRPQLHFVKRGSGAPCRFQATEGASRPSQIQTAAVKIICSNSLLWTAFVRSRHLPVPVMHS